MPKKNELACKFPLLSSYTIYICISGRLFLILSLYLFLNKKYFTGFIVCLLYTTTYLYWRKPEKNIIRTIDIMYVRFVIGYFFYNIFKNIEDIDFIIISLSITLHGIFFFIISNLFYLVKNPIWIACHMIFHIYSFIAIFTISLFIRTT